MTAKKNLIVYYSRTGTSEALAKVLREKLACDIDRIDYAEERDGISFLAAGWEAIRRTTKAIQGNTRNPENYDHIFFVSPVWSNRLSTPIRSYMRAYRDKIKSYSLLVTCGGSALSKVKRDARSAMGKNPEASAEFKSKEVNEGEYDLKRLFSQFETV